MKLALELLDIYTPSILKRRVLCDIFVMTAGAFGTAVPDTKGLSAGRLLEAYARFTRRAGEAALRGGSDPEAVRLRLFQNARDLGRTLRERFRLRSPEDVPLLLLQPALQRRGLPADLRSR